MGADAASARQLCERAEVGEESASLLREGMPPGEFVLLLRDRERYADAIRLLAHALPKREAVWWAWVSARRASGSAPEPKIKAALDATEKWLMQPTDNNRRLAKKTAEEADIGTPAGCAGMAAFFSGGSLAPPEVPAVPPADDLTAKAVVGAILLAAVASEPEKAPEKFQSFVDQGMEVVKRINLW